MALRHEIATLAGVVGVVTLAARYGDRLPVPTETPDAWMDVDVDDGLSGLAIALFAERHGIQLRMRPAQTGGYEVDPIEETFVPWAIGLSEDFVAAYPDRLLREALDEIGFASGAFDEVGSIGGFASCSRRRMVVTVHGDRSHDDVLAVMHHELGHLVHCLVGTPPGWSAMDDVPYQGGSAAWRGEVWDGTRSRRAHGDAFVTSYAMSSEKEDIAETFEACMVGLDTPPTHAVARKVALLQEQVQARFPTFRCQPLPGATRHRP
jgi:hypothetical protein